MKKQTPEVQQAASRPALTVEYWPTEKPIPYARNARKLKKNAIDSVAASLTEFGWRQAIVVDVEGVVVAGHTRLLAAKQLGMAEVPVHVATGLTPEQIKAYRLADNRTHENAEWDLELVELEIAELHRLNYNLLETGFRQAEIDNCIRKAGLVPEDELPEAGQLISVAGDLWLLGPHRLLCGDSTSPEAVERVLAGAKPELMVTDPPYGVELDGEWRDRAGYNHHGPAEKNYLMNRTEGHTNTTISGDTRADWSEAFELVPSLQIAYVWHASKFTSEVLAGLLRIGFLHHQQIIWNKRLASMTRTHYWFQHEPCWYVRKHEPCWYVRKKNAAWFGEPGKNATVWDTKNETGDDPAPFGEPGANSTIWEAASPKMIMGGSKEEKYDHPTQKPVELMRRSIVNHTTPGEVVYEPFGGSGTTMMAAEETGRVCCSIELDPRFVDVIVRRWQGFTGLKATLDGTTDRTFDEVAAGRTAA